MLSPSSPSCPTGPALLLSLLLSLLLIGPAVASAAPPFVQDESGRQQEGPFTPSPGPGQPGNQAGTLAVEYVRSLPMTDRMIGYGLDFQLGRWVLKRPIFTSSLPGTPVALGQETVYEESTGLQTTYSSAEASLDLEFSSGLVSFAAGLTVEEAGSSRQRGVTLGLHLTNLFEPEFVDFTGSGVSYTSEALEILAMPSSVQRDELWRSYFGRFVIFGMHYEGRLGVQAQIKDYSTSTDSSVHAYFDGEWGPIGNASVDFDQFLSSAASGGALDLSLVYEGDEPLDLVIPSIEELADASVRSAFINALISQATGRVAPRSLIVATSAVIPNAPAFTPSWDLGLLESSVSASETALKNLNRAYRFNFPYSLRRFLESRSPSPGGPSYGQMLDDARGGLLLASQDLWNAYKSYFEGDNASQGQYEDALLDAIFAVVGANAEMDQVLLDLSQGSLDAQLPPATIIMATPYYTPSGAPSYDNRTWAVDVEIDNVALFNDGDLSSYGGFGLLFQMLDVRVRGTHCPGGAEWVQLGWLPHKNPITILSVEQHQGGPGAGLSRVRLRLPLLAGECVAEVRLLANDMLGRATLPVVHSMYSNSPIWPF